ncbi:hypothetical protein [Vibrio splendidus]|uniref:hypothetical protein n=1 Tax=Vibrio splendidus TaxID=29497 RepID=UPI0011B2218B|nr:hypothetical protein [Vibrio splendidus]
MMLEAFVNLYRTLDKPRLQDGGDLEFNCVLDEKTLDLLNLVSDSGISVDEIEQGNNFYNLSDATANGLSSSVLLKIPANGDYNIFRDLDDLLDRATELTNGQSLDEYYVCEDDYWSTESTSTESTSAESTSTKIKDEYTNLKRYAELVKGLEKLASYHDKKQNSTHHELVFISNDESITSKPVVLRPHITLELLSREVMNTSTIKELTSKKSDGQANINRERAIFKVSIIEFFETIPKSQSTSNFKHLVCNWDEFISLYNNNFETYLSGFAFHKAKKEVADIELQVAEQYSKVLGDIAGKLFGLPVSFAALLGLFSEKATTMSDTLILISIISASWLMTRLVSNQRAQLERITHAKDISFGSIKGKSTQYPRELQEEITSAKTAIDLNAGRLKRDLAYLSTLVWAPLSIGLSLYLCRHRELIEPLTLTIKTICLVFSSIISHITA